MLLVSWQTPNKLLQQMMTGMMKGQLNGSTHFQASNPNRQSSLHPVFVISEQRCVGDRAENGA